MDALLDELDRTMSNSRRVDRLFTGIGTRVAHIAGQPLAFLLALGAIFAWLLSGPLFRWSDTWQLVVNTGTTVITFLMVFLIQNSQNRDAAAMQAKLDELIRALDDARAQFIGIEHLPDGEIEEIRASLEEEVGYDNGKTRTAQQSVKRLLERR